MEHGSGQRWRELVALDTALLRRDLTLHKNRGQLERFFVRKPIFCWEAF